MIVGILANTRKADAHTALDALRRVLHERGISTVLDEDTAAWAGETDGIPADTFAQRVDLAAVLGGDGTMLHAVGKLGAFDKPVAGINIGTLGFLTSCTDEEVDVFADALAQQTFTTSVRTLLEAKVICDGMEPQTFYALNEITLARGQTGRLVSLRASVNGELLNHYRADGLIVATPTGSTAYSLSAGGPLIAPQSRVFLITPVCPHSLSQRSLVVEDDATIELAPDKVEEGPMLFTVDGRDILPVDATCRVEVRKAARQFHLLRLPERSFYEALRQKLHWHGG